MICETTKHVYTRYKSAKYSVANYHNLCCFTVIHYVNFLTKVNNTLWQRVYMYKCFNNEQQTGAQRDLTLSVESDTIRSCFFTRNLNARLLCIHQHNLCEYTGSVEKCSLWQDLLTMYVSHIYAYIKNSNSSQNYFLNFVAQIKAFTLSNAAQKRTVNIGVHTVHMTHSVGRDISYCYITACEISCCVI